MKLCSDDHNNVETQHMKICPDVNIRVGTLRIKVFLDVHTRVGTLHMKIGHSTYFGWGHNTTLNKNDYDYG